MNDQTVTIDAAARERLARHLYGEFFWTGGAPAWETLPEVADTEHYWRPEVCTSHWYSKADRLLDVITGRN